MRLTDQRLIERIDDVLALNPSGADANAYGTVNAALQATLTLLIAVHGPNSQQQAMLIRVVDNAQKRPTGVYYNFMSYVWPAVLGTLDTLRADIEAGLVGSIRRRTFGESIVDMLTLAKEALGDAPGGKNVAAVLSAAAFEDAIRKLGSIHAGIQGREKLSDILTSLKRCNVIDGPPLTTAQSYLKFRNDALHADWDRIDSAVVGSCIAFVEGLVLQHFS